MSGWATSPQAAQIDALIERAGLLTLVECERLAAARAAAWGAARAAVGFAARVAAQDAAQDAAEALVVRDLIDEATEWNQAAYDLVTGPWRRVIGPIHPDDEVLR